MGSLTMRNDKIVTMENMLSDTCKLTCMYMFMYSNCAAVNKTEGCHLKCNKCKVSNSNINNNAIKRFIDMYKIFQCDLLLKIHVICIYNHVDHNYNCQN